MSTSNTQIKQNSFQNTFVNIYVLFISLEYSILKMKYMNKHDIKEFLSNRSRVFSCVSRCKFNSHFLGYVRKGVVV